MVNSSLPDISSLVPSIESIIQTYSESSFFCPDSSEITEKSFLNLLSSTLIKESILLSRIVNGELSDL